MSGRIKSEDFLDLVGILLILFMGLFPSISSKIAYFHFAVIALILALVFLTGLFNLSCKKEKIFQILLFYVLILISLFGCIKGSGDFAVRNVGALICLTLFIIWYTNRETYHLNKDFLFFLFTIYLIIVLLLFKLVPQILDKTGNLYAGFICFISCCGMMIYMQQENKKHNSLWVALYVILTIYLLFVTRGRTGLGTYIFIWGFYLGTKKLQNKKKYRRLFYIYVLCLVAVIVFYIYLPTFSWYRDVNKYSLLLFNKNLNSSRGGLWLNELARLEDGTWLTGLGTGTLPAMERYSKSSFHSSFIQIMMQNGIIGLICLVFIFYGFWKQFAFYLEDNSIRYAGAILLGIMLYNCFEVTLLQNKISVGISEWFILCRAISRIDFLKKQVRVKKHDK